MLKEHCVDSKLERHVVVFQDPAKKCGKSRTILSAILGFLCLALPYLSFSLLTSMHDFDETLVVPIPEQQ